VNTDGSAGAAVLLESSTPMGRPDGLRAVGPQTLIQAEQQGRLTEITINGNRAEVRVVRDGLTRASGVTMVGGNAIVLVELTKALVVPYTPR
jgi:hypothetical protein